MVDARPVTKSLRPLVLPFLLCLVLFMVSQVLFAEARNASVPPHSDTLFMERVRLDTVRGATERLRRPGPLDGTIRRVRLAQSSDWPGLTFHFDTLTAGVAIAPPVTFDLYVDRPLAEAAESHRQFPNVFPTLAVYGIADGSQLLVDPDTEHDRVAAHQQRTRVFAWGALALCLLPGYLLFHQARGLWRNIVA